MWPNPQFPVDFVIFTEEILNGKLHFSVQREISWYVDEMVKAVAYSVCPETETWSVSRNLFPLKTLNSPTNF